jgi:hypothetical protein
VRVWCRALQQPSSVRRRRRLPDDRCCGGRRTSGRAVRVRVRALRACGVVVGVVVVVGAGTKDDARLAVRVRCLIASLLALRIDWLIDYRDREQRT